MKASVLDGIICSMKKQIVEFYPPLYSSSVSAGFPSPAEDYIDKKLDLNELVVKRPNSTFFVRVAGNSMIKAGIHDGDILCVDRSIEARSDDIVLAILDGEFTVKRLKISKSKISLVPENPDYKIITVNEGNSFEVWGVVTWSLKEFTSGR